MKGVIMMTNMNNNTTTTATIDFRAFAQGCMDRLAAAYATGKLTAEQCTQECDADINMLKAGFFNSIDTLSRLSGITTLKFDVARIFEAGCNERTGRKELMLMAREIRTIVDNEIETLEMCFASDRADILRKAFHEESLIETFIKAIVWMAGKLWRKVKKLVGYIGININEDSIIGAICKGVAALSHLVLAGAKVVFNIAKYTASVVGAGALLIADYVWHGICWLFSKAKDLWNKARNMFPADEGFEEFDEDFLDADFSTETEENNAQ